MKLAMRSLFLCAFIAIIFSSGVSASGITQSSRNEIFDNPFIVTGFNKKSNILTGYISILRTSPGRTDECKIAFAGQYVKEGPIKILLQNAEKDVLNDAKPKQIASGEIRVDPKMTQFIVAKKDLPGDCDWILDFADDKRIIQKGGTIFIQIENGTIGTWVAVSVIKVPKAYFHKGPNKGSIGNAYLTSGDLAYIFDEQSEWYFVRFQGRKKETVGWIKKTDMIQFPL